jgi:Protein of unknown function (DUF1194)
MGRHGFYGAIASVLTGAGLALAASATPNLPRLVDKGLSDIPVDVELVIAVDISYSMDPDEQALQREGHVLALTSREFMQALREGANGKIAMTYFEWAGEFDQKIIMPWRLIEGRRDRQRDCERALPAHLAHVDFRRANFRRAAVRPQRLSRLGPGDRCVRRRHQQFRAADRADAR